MHENKSDGFKLRLCFAFFGCVVLLNAQNAEAQKSGILRGLGGSKLPSHTPAPKAKQLNIPAGVVRGSRSISAAQAQATSAIGVTGVKRTPKSQGRGQRTDLSTFAKKPSKPAAKHQAQNEVSHVSRTESSGRKNRDSTQSPSKTANSGTDSKNTPFLKGGRSQSKANKHISSEQEAVFASRKSLGTSGTSAPTVTPTISARPMAGQFNIASKQLGGASENLKRANVPQIRGKAREELGAAIYKNRLALGEVSSKSKLATRTTQNLSGSTNTRTALPRRPRKKIQQPRVAMQSRSMPSKTQTVEKGSYTPVKAQREVKHSSPKQQPRASQTPTGQGARPKNQLDTKAQSANTPRPAKQKQPDKQKGRAGQSSLKKSDTKNQKNRGGQQPGPKSSETPSRSKPDKTSVSPSQRSSSTKARPTKQKPTSANIKSKQRQTLGSRPQQPRQSQLSKNKQSTARLQDKKREFQKRNAIQRSQVKKQAESRKRLQAKQANTRRAQARQKSQSKATKRTQQQKRLAEERTARNKKVFETKRLDTKKRQASAIDGQRRLQTEKSNTKKRLESKHRLQAQGRKKNKIGASERAKQQKQAAEQRTAENRTLFEKKRAEQQTKQVQRRQQEQRQQTERKRQDLIDQQRRNTDQLARQTREQLAKAPTASAQKPSEIIVDKPNKTVVSLNGRSKHSGEANTSGSKPPEQDASNGVMPGPAKVRSRSGASGELQVAFAKIEPHNIGQGTATNASSRVLARQLGNAIDDAGHAIGNNLGGLGGVRGGNIFPQAPSVNRGVFNQFEQQIARRVQAGDNVFVRVVPQYANGGTRPISILYQVRINGQTTSRTFPNQ